MSGLRRILQGREGGCAVKGRIAEDTRCASLPPRPLPGVRGALVPHVHLAVETEGCAGTEQGKRRQQAGPPARELAPRSACDAGATPRLRAPAPAAAGRCHPSMAAVPAQPPPGSAPAPRRPSRGASVAAACPAPAPPARRPRRQAVAGLGHPRHSSPWREPGSRCWCLCPPHQRWQGPRRCEHPAAECSGF